MKAMELQKHRPFHGITILSIKTGAQNMLLMQSHGSVGILLYHKQHKGVIIVRQFRPAVSTQSIWPSHVLMTSHALFCSFISAVANHYLKETWSQNRHALPQGLNASCIAINAMEKVTLRSSDMQCSCRGIACMPKQMWSSILPFSSFRTSHRAYH